MGRESKHQCRFTQAHILTKPSRTTKGDYDTPTAKAGYRGHATFYDRVSIVENVGGYVLGLQPHFLT